MKGVPPHDRSDVISVEPPGLVRYVTLQIGNGTRNRRARLRPHAARQPGGGAWPGGRGPSWGPRASASNQSPYSLYSPSNDSAETIRVIPHLSQVTTLQARGDFEDAAPEQRA